MTSDFSKGYRMKPVDTLIDSSIRPETLYRVFRIFESRIQACDVVVAPFSPSQFPSQ